MRTMRTLALRLVPARGGRRVPGVEADDAQKLIYLAEFSQNDSLEMQCSVWGEFVFHTFNCDVSIDELMPAKNP